MFLVSDAQCNYPPLFHYTPEHVVSALLQSKAIHARAIWRFDKDTHEQVHGLRVALSVLQRMARFPRLDLFPSDLRHLYINLPGGFSRLVEAVISRVEYEIKNSTDPNVQVFVACFTTEKNSARLAKEYGGAILRFNKVLPYLSYLAPSPFSGSMLSRVSYEEKEFESKLRPIAFDAGFAPLRPSLMNMEADRRFEAVAIIVTQLICTLSPNLKRRKHFHHEHEWRLKVVRTLNSGEVTYFDRTEDKKRLVLADMATPVAGDIPKYALPLSIGGRFITDIEGSNDAAKAAVVDTAKWRAENEFPIYTLDEFRTYYDRTDARAGVAPHI
jgi:hypothetical protein